MVTLRLGYQKIEDPFRNKPICVYNTQSFRVNDRLLETANFLPFTKCQLTLPAPTDNFYIRNITEKLSDSHFPAINTTTIEQIKGP